LSDIAATVSEWLWMAICRWLPDSWTQW